MLIGSAMFGAAFMCRTTAIFETLEDGILKIISVALNKIFSYKDVFQNGVNALSKMVLRTPTFCQKAQNFV